MIAICFEVDHTTAARGGDGDQYGTKCKALDEGAVPTTLILGVKVYITLVDHLCTSFWTLDAFYGGI